MPISGWYIYFWQIYSPKPYPWWRHFSSPKPYPLMTLFLKLRFWATFLDIAQKKWHFWHPKIKLVQKKTNLLFKKNYSKIWPYVTQCWPDPSLSLTCMESDWKMASIFEFYVQKNYKLCAACPKNSFWLWWPFVTLLDLTLTLIRTYYGTYAHRVCSLAIWGCLGWVSSKNYRYCRP